MTIPVDWASLNSELVAYAGRDPTNVPTFIRFGENRVAKDLRTARRITETTITVNPTERAATLPTNYLATESVKANGKALTYIGVESLDYADENYAAFTEPMAYSVVGTSLYTIPAWPAGGPVTLRYIAKESPLSAVNTTNWYILNIPEALFYACMLEAAIFTKDDEAAMKYVKAYTDAMETANKQFAP